MDLFTLAGTIAIDFSNAISGIQKTSNEAKSSESIITKLTTTIGKVGTAIAGNFKPEPIDDTKESVDDVKISLTELSKAISSQETELGKLKSKYQDLYLTLGENAEETEECAKQIKELSTELKDNKSKLSEAENAADKLDATMDDLGDSVEDSGESAEKASDGYTVWKNVLSNLATKVIDSVISKVTQLANKMVELTESAVSNYAEYEQLIGGVETLFGDSADTLISYANSAYKTAQLSANDYMDTATSFAASLIQGLGGDTAAAVELTNLAITDMADNANKMGTDISSIQDAYQGFAKQNYTMLDNLKLGYGGTQSEMIRLINDSGILNETISDLDDITFDQMIEAIHVIQTNLGITGTTAEEAGSTISGSWNSVQALFQNILTTVGAQLAPTVMSFLTQLSEWMEGVDWSAFADSIGAALADVLSWIQQIDFETFFQAGVDGIVALIEGLGSLVMAIVNVVSWWQEHNTLMSLVTSAVIALVSALATFSVIQKVIEMVSALKTAFTALFTVMSANPISIIVALIVGLVAGFIYLWNNCEGFRNFWINLWDNIKSAISTAVERIQAVFAVFQAAFAAAWDAFKSKIDQIEAAIDVIVAAIAATIKNFEATVTAIFEVIKSAIVNAWNTIKTNVSTAVNAIKSTVTTVFNAVSSYFTNVLNIYKTAFTTAWNAIKSAITTAVNAIKNTITTVFNAIKTTITNVINAVKTTVTNVFNAIKTSISAPINAAKATISTVFSAIKTTITNVVNSVKSTVTTVFNNIKTAITSPITSAKNTLVGILDSIKSKFTSVFTSAKDTVSNAISKIKGMFNFTWSLPKIKLPHFSIKPSGWSIGDLLKGSIPSLGISWYAKAMDDGMIMESPTVFGVDSASGQLLAGGEAGSETVVGTDSLMSMIQSAVAVENQELVSRVESLISLLDGYLSQLVSDTASIKATSGSSQIDSLVEIKEMNVRSEDDIKKISQQLYKQLQTARRANGYA